MRWSTVKAQLGLAVYALLIFSELWSEMRLALDLWRRGWAGWALLCGGIPCFASGLRALYLTHEAPVSSKAGWRLPVYFLRCWLHLDVLEDLARMTILPKWHTLHPRFALPLVEFIMSTLNSAPQSAIQCYLLVSTGELRPLAALNIFCGLASIAWSLVNFELIDFRGRQVVATARPQGHTLALLCFRIGELTARTSALALAASVVETLPTLSQRLAVAGLYCLMEGALLALSFALSHADRRKVLHEFFGGEAQGSGYLRLDRSLVQLWVCAVFAIAFWDFRCSGSNVPFVSAKPFFLLRGLEQSLMLAIVATQVHGPLSDVKSAALLCCIVASLVTGLLVAPVARFHWSHRLHLQRPSASVTEERPRLATPVRVAHRDLLASLQRRQRKSSVVAEGD